MMASILSLHKRKLDLTVVVFSLLFFVKCQSQSAPQCVIPGSAADSGGVCTFETDQGTIDLTPLDASPGPRWKDVQSVDIETTDYSYNPCTPFTEGSAPGCTNVAVCDIVSSSYFTDVGVHSSAQCQNDATGLYIQYTSADTFYSSKVYLVCDKHLTEPQFSANSISGPSGKPELTITAKAVCPNSGGGNGGLSTGSVLCIIFVVLVLVYLIVGGSFMYFGRGARGTDIIPNISFWKEQPSLIKDGCLFVVSKVRGGSSTYENI